MVFKNIYNQKYSIIMKMKIASSEVCSTPPPPFSQKKMKKANTEVNYIVK